MGNDLFTMPTPNWIAPKCRLNWTLQRKLS